jgi:glycosyltransferase involved in cell wall biosynthesis
MSADEAGSTAATLTVVLPNYNHAALLPHALDALLAQDRPADQILVVDDGSTDNSLEILHSYQARAPSIHILANGRNIGVIATLKRGLEEARGRYVYFAASDDWVWPGFFRRALTMLEKHPGRGLFCADAMLVDARDGRVIGFRPITRPIYRQGEVSPAQARRLLARIDNWTLTGSTVFRRRCVIEAGGFDERMGTLADGHMSRKIALTNGFCYAPVTVATWCISYHSASRVTARSQAEEVLRAAPPLIKADPVFPDWYADLFGRRWRFATSRLALEAKPFDRMVLRSMVPLSAMICSALEAALPTPVARFVMLSVLWLYLRPTSLRSVVRTAIARRLDRSRA